MTTRITLLETPEEAIRRLARKAQREGVKLYRDPTDGRYYASSVSIPDHLHYVTGVSCDCPGFASYQRCKHHSALLVALGWVEGDSTPDPEPTPIIGRIVRCGTCHGLGETPYTRSTGPRRYVEDWETCHTCRGCGVEKKIAA